MEEHTQFLIAPILHNLKNATGLNSQKWRCYKPGQEKDFSVSRSRFEDFSKCPRCFYLRMVKCLQQPEGPPFRLNELTDTLLKKEFDEYQIWKSGSFFLDGAARY